MPGMNGVELAIAMSKMFPAARILLFSGQAGISDILLDGHRQGFEFELIAKPIHPLKLIELLKISSHRTDPKPKDCSRDQSVRFPSSDRTVQVLCRPALGGRPWSSASYNLHQQFLTLINVANFL